MKEQSNFWDYEHKQFAKGKFRGQILATHSRNLQISYTYRAPGIFIRGGTPPDATVISIPCSPEQSIFYRGRPLGAHNVLALNPGEELDLQATQASALITIAVEQKLLDSHCLTLTGIPFKKWRSQERLFIDPVDYDIRVKRLAWLLDHLLKRDSKQTLYREKEALLEKEILGTVLTGARIAGVTQNIPVRLQVAKRAEILIRSNLKTPMPIMALCRAIGTSERTLHLGFKERFGVSPKKYFTIMRLNGVRMDLRSNNDKRPVSDIAVQWGFFHLGRFSEQYKLMFNELPSQTNVASMSKDFI